MILNLRNRRIVLVGKAASGKDHLRKRFQDRHFNYAVTYTTRPPRENEVEGIDYHFISEETANFYISKNLFYEWVEFNGWIYGTTIEQFNTKDLFIMTPKGISKIKPEDRESTFIIYLDIPEDVRRKRLLERIMPGDSLERRIIVDEEDFSNFFDYDLRITNADF